MSRKGSPVDPDVVSFWVGASWFVGLCLLIAVVASSLVWIDRYMEFDHSHDHSHPAHTHPHEHPHPVAKHKHKVADVPHTHPHEHDVRVKVK